MRETVEYSDSLQFRQEWSKMVLLLKRELKGPVPTGDVSTDNVCLPKSVHGDHTRFERLGTVLDTGDSGRKRSAGGDDRGDTWTSKDFVGGWNQCPGPLRCLLRDCCRTPF